MLKKNYSKDTFDLAELDLHNGIEHDASLTSMSVISHDFVSSDIQYSIVAGDDVYFQPHQGKPHLLYVKELLESATGKDKEGNALLTSADLSRISAIRRVESRAKNPEFTLSTFHKMFGSSKYVLCHICSRCQ